MHIEELLRDPGATLEYSRAQGFLKWRGHWREDHEYYDDHYDDDRSCASSNDGSKADGRD